MHTDEDWFADIREDGLLQGQADLGLWLRDDLRHDDGTNVGIVVRDLPWDDNTACAVLESAVPVSDEVVPIRYWGQIVDGRNSIRQFVDDVDSPQHGDGAIAFGQHRVFRYRPSLDAGDRVACWRAGSDLSVQSGDILIVDADAALFTEAGSFDPSAYGDVKRCHEHQLHDIFNHCQDEMRVCNSHAIQHSQSFVDSLVDAVASVRGFDDTSSTSQTHDRFFEQVQEIARAIWQECGDVSEGPAAVLVDGVFDDSLASDAGVDDNTVKWVVLRSDDSLTGSEESQDMLRDRQSKTLLLGGMFGDGSMTAGHECDANGQGHQDHVADRAWRIGVTCGMSEPIVQALHTAGLWHDAGKCDERFQTMLRYGRARRPQEAYFAKSRFIAVDWERRFRAEHQLRGWRHEQRSVIAFAQYLENHGDIPDGIDPQLVKRLIGTSHGHGRSAYRHGAQFVVPQGEGDALIGVQGMEAARRLFEVGEWETLMDRTNEQYGLWGASYLEALLRAADITCSKEGK